MKKIILLCTMTLGTMAFANGKEESKVETKTEAKEAVVEGCKRCVKTSCGSTCYTDPGGDCDKALKKAKELAPCPLSFSFEE